MLLRSRLTIPSWTLVPGIAVLAVSLAAYGLLKRHAGMDPYDLRVYLMGGQAWMDGLSVYHQELPTAFGPGHFTYPPVTLLGYGPLSELPQGVAHGAMIVLSLAALWAVVWLVLRMAGVQRGAGLVGLSLAITGAALWLQPVHDSLHQGQINILLMLLVVTDFARGGRWQGVMVGIATAIKVTPGIFIVYLLITKRWRAAGIATGTTAAVTGIGVAVAPRDSVTFWFERFGDTAWMVSPVSPADVQNQSLYGVVMRLTGSTTLWVVAALVVLAGGLLIARSLHRVDPIAGLLTAAVTGLLISPLSWHEHWVWIVPIGAWLGVAAWRLRESRPILAGALPLPVLAFLTWPIPSAPGMLDAASILSPARAMWEDGERGVIVAGAGAAYVLVGLGLLVGGAILVGRRGVAGPP